MIYESPAVFNPPEFNDDAPSPDGSVASDNIQMPQPTEAHEADASEPVAATEETAGMQGDLEIGTSAQDNIAPGSAKDEGYLDTSGEHEPIEKPFFESKEEALSPDMANDNAFKKATHLETLEDFPVRENAITRATERVSDKKNRESAGEENMEKEFSHEVYEKYVDNKVGELINESPNNYNSEEDFVRGNLTKVSDGIRGSARLVNSMLEGRSIKIGQVLNGTAMIGFGEDNIDNNASDVFGAAFSIGVAKHYATEHPKALLGMLNRLSENNPEYTADEVLEDAIFYLADRRKKDQQNPNVAYYIASGLEEIAKNAEKAARDKYQKHIEERARAEQQLQEIDRIIGSWGDERGTESAA